jgi:hypothetical protein
MRYARTLRNETQGTEAVVRLDGDSVMIKKGAALFPLSGHQVRRLRKKLNPTGMGIFHEIGWVGQSPEVQECPELPGYQARVILLKFNGAEHPYIEFRAAR